MGAILVAERSLCYHGKLGPCSRCGQPWQRLNAAGLCKACEQRAYRDKKKNGKRLAGTLCSCGCGRRFAPTDGRQKLHPDCRERRYRENNARQVAKCAARRAGR